MTGVDPVMLTEYAVIFSAVALPLTYVPILLVANDRAYMGRYGNGRLANVLGIVYLVVIMIVALTVSPHDPDQRGAELSATRSTSAARPGPPVPGQGRPPLRQSRRPRDRRRPRRDAEVVAILAGPGVWPQRSGRLGRLAGWLGGSKRVRGLGRGQTRGLRRRTAPPSEPYGLANVDDRLRPLVEKIPGADR